MKNRFLFWTLLKLIFSLRYRITIENRIKHIDQNRTFLFFANHISLFDPPLLITVLHALGFKVSPITREWSYRISWLQPLLKQLKAVPIPNFGSTVNQYKEVKAKRALEQIATGLREGQNFLFYPSGMLKNTGKEVIGGASGAHWLVQECPNAKIILIRVTGFWGSTGSKVGLNGNMPNFGKVMKTCLKALLKNLILFSPRRRLLIEIEEAPSTLHQIPNRLQFNRQLESWYNHYSDEKGKVFFEEPLQKVPLSFWEKHVEMKEADKSDFQKVKKKISASSQIFVETEIAKILKQPSLKIHSEMNLTADLGMDSLNIAELAASLSSRIQGVEAFKELNTVQDAFEIAEGYSSQKPLETNQSPIDYIYQWPTEKERPDLQIPLAETMPQAFLQLSRRFSSYYCVADDRMGPITYSICRRKIGVLAELFRSFEEKRIAVLLPASPAAHMIVLALQLAGKVPVMLNWTLGPKYLEQMVQVAQTKRILSSWNFIENLSNVDFGGLVDQIQFLEDLLAQMPLSKKLRGLFASWPIKELKKEDLAVILFTSGSEAWPKGIPLTHENVLSSIRSLMQTFPFSSRDIVYNVLPPFHVMGFTLGIIPMLSGMKSSYFPNPTDYAELAKGIERWKITLITLVPAFVRGLFSTAQKNQLSTLRTIPCGGEKVPESLFKWISSQYSHIRLIEGYGCSECGSCLATDLPSIPHKGIARILHGVEMRTVHPETKLPLSFGEEGELCVSGPQVFSGYLNNLPLPFVYIDGKKWYCTGDIGHIDANNSLFISDRLRRFVKIGGEMISLAAIEEALNTNLADSQSEPILAVCAKDGPEERSLIVLFTTQEISREIANEILKKEGFSSLIKIDTVHQLEKIPLFGSGKINHRHLAESFFNR